MSFHGTKKLLLIVSHDLWAWNWKIVIHGIWNPRACGYLVDLSVCQSGSYSKSVSKSASPLTSQ